MANGAQHHGHVMPSNATMKSVVRISNHLGDKIWLW